MKGHPVSESIVDREMRKLKAMGVTISVTPAAGHDDGLEDRPSGIIAEAAKRHGIYEEN